MSPLATEYYARANELLAKAWTTNDAAIAQAVPLIGRSVAEGGVVHIFGSGHSDVIGREIIGRAGGLACLSGVIDPTNGFIENLPNYGLKLIERYDRQHELRRGETMIVISNSGKNAAPIDVALYAKTKGMNVVTLCCLAMSKVTPSQHPSGKKLYECGDISLDNGGVPGDAIVELTPGVMGGPTSTLIGASILNWLMLGVMDWLKAHGHEIAVLRSQNLPGAIEHNRKLGERYKGRLSRQLA